MSAGGLRWILAVEAFGVVALRRSAGPARRDEAATALAASFAGLLGLYLLFTLATFAVCWPRTSADNAGQKIGVLAACAMIFKEWLAFFALFGVMQPFAELTVLRQARQDCARTSRLFCWCTAINAIRLFGGGSSRACGRRASLRRRSILSLRSPASTHSPSSFTAISKPIFRIPAPIK